MKLEFNNGCGTPEIVYNSNREILKIGQFSLAYIYIPLTDEERESFGVPLGSAFRIMAHVKDSTE